MLEGLAAELEGKPRWRPLPVNALELTDQPMLRSHFEGLIMRQKLLASSADEALVAELGVKIMMVKRPLILLLRNMQWALWFRVSATQSCDRS